MQLCTVKYLKQLHKLFALVFILSVAACRPDLSLENQRLDISTPLAKTKMSIRDFVPKENYVLDNQERITLSYSYPLYSASPTEYFTVPDREDSANVSLENIRLSNTALESSITLEQAYPPAAFLDGQKIMLPATSQQNAVTLPVDAGSFFESAQLESGKMYMKVTNGFPVEVDYLKFELRNKSDGSVVAIMEFNDILPGTTASDSADMAGVYAEGDMEGEMVEVNTAASGEEVTINKDDAVEIQVRVQDLLAYEATAIFPAQNLIELDRAWDYDFGGAQLKEMRIKTGSLKLRVKSNINETIFVTYEVPGLINNGDTVTEYFTVPPATASNPFSEVKTIPLDGAKVILRGKKGEGWLESNAVHYRLTARIDSTGELKTISKEDSMKVYMGLIDLVPDYGLGFIGQDTIEIGPESEDIDIFENTSGALNLQDAKFSLSLNNTSGIDAEVKINSLKSKSRDGREIALNSSVLDENIQIQAASDTSNPAFTSVDLSEENSNTAEFINVLPKSIAYDMEVYLNPGGNDNDFGDWFYDNSLIETNAQIDVPLQIKPEQFTLTDTADVDLSSLLVNEQVKGATLNLIVNNGYPLESRIGLYFLDENDVIQDSLFTNENSIAAAELNASNHQSSKSVKSILSSDFSRERIEKLSMAQKVVFQLSFNTSANQAIHLYDNYSIDIKLTSDLIYEASLR